jgi:hypothetical protein
MNHPPIRNNWPAATSLVPSAEEATDDQEPSGALLCVQVVPESVEVIKPLPAATSLVPSAEEASDDQELLGALVCIQVAPEFVVV